MVERVPAYGEYYTSLRGTVIDSHLFRHLQSEAWQTCHTLLTAPDAPQEARMVAAQTLRSKVCICNLRSLESNRNEPFLFLTGRLRYLSTPARIPSSPARLPPSIPHTIHRPIRTHRFPRNHDPAMSCTRGPRLPVARVEGCHRGYGGYLWTKGGECGDAVGVLEGVGGRGWKPKNTVECEYL